VIARQPTFLSGWRAAPSWFKATIIAFGVVNLAFAAFVMLSFEMSPIFWIVAGLVNFGVVFALVGTVTDVFATPPEQRTAKMRSLAIGIGLLLLVVTFFAATLIRLGGNVFNRPL
jgi:hypothetical protein